MPVLSFLVPCVSPSPHWRPLPLAPLSLASARGSPVPTQRCAFWMWPDAIHMALELRALLPSQGCLRPANPLLLFSELVIHSCLPVIRVLGRKWGRGTQAQSPHSEGNVDSQPMHFNTGKLPGKPEGCAWAPESTVFRSSAGLELMP